MDSILANVFLSVQERLRTEVPEISRWIDQDLGQLEFYTNNPPVSFPCALLDFDDTDYSDEGENSQIADAILIVRLGLHVYSSSNVATPQLYKEKALDYLNLEHKVNKALHGWCDNRFFSPLMRRKAFKEKRDDHLRVRVLRYEFSFRDSTATEVRTSFPVPGLEITD